MITHPEGPHGGIRAVLFDLDGTLVDSYGPIAESLNHTLDHFGLPRRTLDEVRRLVGGGIHEVLRRSAGDSYVEEGVRIFRAHYTTIVLDGTEPLPGALELLEELDRRGYLLGVATNKPSAFARRILDHLEMSRHIRAFAGPDEAGCLKPDPAMLRLLADELGLAPPETVYLGDMPIDAETARTAGARSWLVTTGSATREQCLAARPDRLFERLDEALDLLPPLAPRKEPKEA